MKTVRRYQYLIIISAIVTSGCANGTPRTQPQAQAPIINTYDSTMGFEKYKVIKLDDAYYIRTETVTNRVSTLPDYKLSIVADGKQVILPDGRAELTHGMTYMVFSVAQNTLETVDWPVTKKLLTQLAATKDLTIEGYGETKNTITLTPQDKDAIANFIKQHADMP